MPTQCVSKNITCPSAMENTASYSPCSRRKRPSLASSGSLNCACRNQQASKTKPYQYSGCYIHTHPFQCVIRHDEINSKPKQQNFEESLNKFRHSVIFENQHKIQKWKQKYKNKFWTIFLNRYIIRSIQFILQPFKFISCQNYLFPPNTTHINLSVFY